MKTISFLRSRFNIRDGRFRFFFAALFLTTLIPYLNSIIPVLPGSVLGLNWSGIAWTLMLLLTLLVLVNSSKFSFPYWMWAPWFIYISGYLILDFSFYGLQLTMQYALPLLVGVVASSFRYDWSKLQWLFQSLLKTLAVIYLLFIYYNILYGYTPHMAATPMFFSIGATIGLGVYFLSRSKVFLVLYFLLFLMPFLSVTRMALLVFAAIFILHFANKNLIRKALASGVGAILLLAVFYSQDFQEKTFFEGSGEITDISLGYSTNTALNTSGRSALYSSLESGLQQSPLFGNGPRADAPVLGEVIGRRFGEAHSDYLSVRYNYGWLGLGLLLFGFGFSFIKLFRMSKKLKDPLFQLVSLSMLTLFIPFLLFMYSDNILKYTIWFPNYFFALMGICFSMYRKGYDYD